MRVLIATYADSPSFSSMVPLAWALRNAGHEVRVASQPALVEEIVTSGLTAVSVGEDHEFGAMETWAYEGGEYAEEYDEDEFNLAEDRTEVLTWDYLSDGFSESVNWWWKVINDPMVEDLTLFCRQWRPDLVLWEPVSFAGAVAAEAVGAVHARVLWGMDLMGRMRGRFLDALDERGRGEDPLADWLGERAERAGTDFSERMTRGFFTVDPLPEEVGLGAVPGVERVPMRYVPYNGSAVIPEWLRGDAGRPRVCVSPGAEPERMGGYTIPAPELVAWLGDIDAEMVVVLPEREISQITDVPDNVRLVDADEVPLHVILPRCSALVSHGAPEAVMGALCNGIPQGMLPQRYIFDSPLLAKRLTALRAGTSIAYEDLDVQPVLDMIRRLITDRTLADGARRARALIEREPTPVDVVADIERLVDKYARGVD